jgi:hypothetical protein
VHTVLARRRGHGEVADRGRVPCLDGAHVGEAFGPRDRGPAEAIASGGSGLGPGFGEAFIRIHPDKVNSFGIE